MRLWTAILAGLQVFSGGTVLLDVFPAKHVGLFTLAVAALQAGTVLYMKAPGQAYRPQHGLEE